MLIHRNIVRALYIACVILNGISLILCLCALFYLIFAIFGLSGTPTEVAGLLSNRTQETWAGVKNRTSDTWSGIRDGTENAWSGIRDGTGNALDRTGNALADVRDRTGDALAGAADRTGNAIADLRDRTGNTLSGLRNGTEDAISRIRDGTREAWGDVRDRTSNAWRGLQNRTQSGVNRVFNRTADWIRNAAEPEFKISAKPPFETRFRARRQVTSAPPLSQPPTSESDVEKKSLSSASVGALLLDPNGDLDSQFGLILYLMFYTAVAVLGLLGATMVYRKRKVNFLTVHVVLLGLIIFFNFLAWFGFRKHSPLSQSQYDGGYLLLAALFDFLVLLVGGCLLASLIINRRHHKSVEKPRNSISPIMESGEG